VYEVIFRRVCLIKVIKNISLCFEIRFVSISLNNKDKNFVKMKCAKCWACWRSISTYPLCWCGSENLEVIDDGRHIDTSLIIETVPTNTPGLEVIQLTAIE